MDPDVSSDTVAKTVLPHDLREVWTFVGYTACCWGINARAIRSKTLCVFRGRFHPYHWKGQLAVSAEAGAPDCRGRGKEFVFVADSAEKSEVPTQSDTWDDRIHPEWRHIPWGPK